MKLDIHYIVMMYELPIKFTLCPDKFSSTCCLLFSMIVGFITIFYSHQQLQQRQTMLLHFCLHAANNISLSEWSNEWSHVQI